MKSETKTDLPGKPLLDELKAREKKSKGKTMKTTTTTSNKKTVIVTVLVTLLSIAMIAGLILTGFFLGSNYERSVNQRVQSEASQLTATTVKSLKQ